MSPRPAAFDGFCLTLVVGALRKMVRVFASYRDTTGTRVRTLQPVEYELGNAECVECARDLIVALDRLLGEGQSHEFIQQACEKMVLPDRDDPNWLDIAWLHQSWAWRILSDPAGSVIASHPVTFLTV